MVSRYGRAEICGGAGGANHALNLLDIFLRRVGSMVPDANDAAHRGDVAHLFFAQKARRHIRDLVRFTGSWQRTGVGEDHGLSRNLQRLLHALVAQVRQVYNDPKPIALPDYLATEIGQTAQMGRLRVDVAERFDVVVALVHGLSGLRNSRVAIEAFLKKTGAQLWIQHDFTADAKLKKAPDYYE